MKLVVTAVYNMDTQNMEVTVDSELDEDVDDDGNATLKVSSPELAFMELLKDVAMGLIDPKTKGFWDRPINMIEEYEAYHEAAAKDIIRGKYGPNVSSSRIG